MALPIPPNQALDLLEVEPAQPELAPAQPLPPLPNHLHPDLEDKDEEEPFEDEEEEIEEQMFQDVSSDEEMDEPELIHPYEAPGSPYPPPPLSDTSSDSEPETDEIATVGTITQVPLARRMFPRGIYERGGSSSSAPIIYEAEELVPSYMRRDINSLYGKVKVLERQMVVRELEGERSLSRDRLAHNRMNLLDLDLGLVERQQDKNKSEVDVLGKRVREWDDEGLRVENKKLKHRLEDVELSREFDRMTNERLEKDLYEMRRWAYDHWEEMIRLGYDEERSCDVTDVLAVYGETLPPEPRGSPRDH